MAAKKKILNSEGQAIFEFIVFLPLLLALVTMMITTGNAINAMGCEHISCQVDEITTDDANKIENIIFNH